MNDTIPQWNRAAALYANDQETSEFAEVNKAVVKERFSSLDGLSVLDLGCGYGWYADYFTSIGADITACDGSEAMLSLAKAKYPSIRFDQADLLKPLPYRDRQFDLVFSNQVLMDIDPLDGLFREINRILKHDGIFYFSIVHPAFYDCLWGKDETGFRRTKIMEKYLTPYFFENRYWGETRHYHRTISWYLNAVTDAGFRLLHMDEPKSYDGIHKSDEFPLFLFAEFEKMNP